jgi:hypothetical protein
MILGLNLGIVRLVLSHLRPKVRDSRTRLLHAVRYTLTIHGLNALRAKVY